MMFGVVTKLSRPVAKAISKKTGIPVQTVTRGIEMLAPVVIAVVSKKAARRKGGKG
ncbi:hypothetical protein ACOBQB_22835 [Streptomyces sp. G5(2025)]|uniref:hypothetical protein n=1 Tax=Streptomyces sp. G5(2025) TaxID=3406628 RepID=UPI003C20EF44